jgi:hypothetical protein
MVDTLTLAKILNTSGNSCGLDKSDLDREIKKRAAATRAPNESEAQAYTRIMLTDDGRELYKALRAAPAAAPPKPAVQDVKPEPAGPASKELEDLARDMARAKSYSYQQAFSRLYTDPERKALVRRYDKEQEELKQRITNARFPLNNAERSSRTESWVRELDAVGRHRFRPNSQ